MTHHRAIDLLRKTAPKLTIHADRRFVDNGRVVSSAGIDMSLHVFSRLLSKEVAEKAARWMAYSWQSPIKTAGK